MTDYSRVGRQELIDMLILKDGRISDLEKKIKEGIEYVHSIDPYMAIDLEKFYGIEPTTSSK